MNRRTLFADTAGVAVEQLVRRLSSIECRLVTFRCLVGRRGEGLILGVTLQAVVSLLELFDGHKAF